MIELTSSNETGLSRGLRWLFPSGVQKQDLLLPILTVLIMIAVTLGSLQVFRLQQYDSDLIDLAGRQRMLLLRYHLETGATPTTSEKADQVLHTLLETSRALRYGGLVHAASDGDRWIQIEPVGEAPLQERLDRQVRMIEGLLGAPRNTGSGGTDAKRVEDEISNAGEIVRLYVGAAQTHVRNLMLFTLALTSVLGLLGLLLSRLIFERRRQLDLLTQARDTALRASQAKTQFLANMSHEIRTPLNAIIGMTDILHGTALSREQARFLKTLRRAGDTLLALISDILDLARIESDQIELDLREVDVVGLVESLGEIMALRAHQKGLELTCYVSPDVPPYLLADETRLRQILINLLGNAVKFTSAGEVNLRLDLDFADEQNVGLKFSVSDTGIGIPESKFGSIFDNFSQADASISVNYGGTGLGLAICKRLVALMNGKIWLKSKIGVGSTFFFTVSVKRAKIKTEVPSLQNFLRKKVLVVDDNDTNRVILHKYLEEASMQIDEARSGLEALEHLRKARQEGSPYDVILLDFRMPGLSGIEVAEHIRKESLANGTLIMLLTSDGKRTDLGRLGDIGIAEFMIKPIRKRELLEAMTRNLTERKVEPSAIDETDAAPITGRGRRILVVDDVEDNRFVVATYLENSGFQVDEAADGQEAIDKFKKTSYDLVFMDLRMAPVDGYTAVRAIREFESGFQRSPVPIIALSAQAMKSEIDRAMDCGCNDHMAKPVTRNQLFAVLRKYFKDEVGEAPTDMIIPQLDDFLKPRLPGYLKTLRGNLEKVPQWRGTGDYESIIRFGHNVSGSAGMYGLDELGKMASQLEFAAKDKKDPQISDFKGRMEKYAARIKAD